MVLTIHTLKMARKIAGALPKLGRGEYFKCAIEIAKSISEWHEVQHGQERKNRC
jgi:hypothetical protein